MRWSLILSTFVAVWSVLSFVSHALPVPPSSSVELEGRGVIKAPKAAPAKKQSSITTAVKAQGKLKPQSSNVKAQSATYRAASMLHQDAYKVSPAGKVTRTPLAVGQRLPYGKKAITGKDADHVYEAQMYNKHLQNHQLDHKSLPPALQSKVKGIMNGPKNMAIIDKGINRGKGQVIKQAMEGNTVKPKDSRDQYIKLSLPTAQKTAKQLDKAFKDEKVPLKTSFSTGLQKTMKVAKV